MAIREARFGMAEVRFCMAEVRFCMAEVRFCMAEVRFCMAEAPGGHRYPLLNSQVFLRLITEGKINKTKLK